MIFVMPKVYITKNKYEIVKFFFIMLMYMPLKAIKYSAVFTGYFICSSR